MKMQEVEMSAELFGSAIDSACSHNSAVTALILASFGYPKQKSRKSDFGLLAAIFGKKE